MQRASRGDVDGSGEARGRPTRRHFLYGAGIAGLAAGLPLSSLVGPVKARAAAARTQVGASGALSNGNRVFLERGLLLGAWVTTAATGRYVPSAEEWQASGFNTVVWYEEPFFDTAFLQGLATATQWGVAAYPGSGSGSHLTGPPVAGTQVLGDSDQRANLSRLFSVSFGDEELYSGQDVSWVQQWIALGRSQLGTDHVFSNNQYQGEWGASQLATYLGQAKPDLITYDNYPFGGPAPYATGNRPDILDGLNAYRLAAGAGVDGSGQEPIPFGEYTEGYRGGSGYSYVPSESEILFDHHAIWTFGGKWAVMFRWEHDPSVFLFYLPDGSHSPQFAQFGTALRQSRLLSPYLVRLQNRDVRIDLGQHLDPTTGAAAPNGQPTSVAVWDSYATPYLQSIQVQNTGGANHGLRGDAILGSFTPLSIPAGTKAQPLPAADAAFLAQPNIKFLMLLNGLIAPNSQGGNDAVDGFSAQTRQRFTLTLARIADRPSEVRALDLQAGGLALLEPIAQTSTSDTVQLDLGGGTATLVCVRTGGPTVDDGPTLTLTPAQPVTDAQGQVGVIATLTNTTSGTIGGLAAQLELPAGWSSSPSGTTPVGSLAPGTSTKVTWTVQAPTGAASGSYTIQALVTWPYGARTTALGGVRASAVLRVPYESGPIAAFQPSSLKVDAGGSAPVTISLTNSGSAATTVTWQTSSPAGGVSASPAQGTTTISPGATVQIPVTVSVSAGAAPGVRTLAIHPAAGSAPFVPRSVPIQIGAGVGTVEAVVATFSTPSATVINTSTDSVVAAVTVGSNPGSVIVSADGTTAWVANQSSRSVTRIDLTTNTVAATVTVGNVPAGLALTPDGTTLWVSNYSDNNVQPVDVATNQAGATISVGSSPENLVVTPDGHWLYVANQASNTVTPIDLTTRTVGAAIQVQTSPFDIVSAPDGATVYCGSATGSTIIPIVTATNQALSPMTVSGVSYGLRVAPDGSTLWVTDSSSNTATPVDTATGLPGKPVAVGNSAADIALTWDGATAYVACASDNTVVPFDTGTRTVGAPISTTGKYPLAIAVTPLPVA